VGPAARGALTVSGEPQSWAQWEAAGTSEEQARLTLLERAYDPLTVAHLGRTGVAAGWRCLEVGAGAGSIARWLAGRAGPSGVIATELFPQHLASTAELGVRVLRHDVAVDPPPGGEFDLIHARLVLEHVQARDQALERLASWLAPGGWLVVEDATFVPDLAMAPALRRVEEAFLSVATGRVGSDLRWARTFPLPLERAGLGETSAEVSMPVMRGGAALAESLALAVRLAGPELLAAGAITAAELDEIAATLADPSVVDCSFLIVAAWGRRPQTT